ncbi:MAG: hypothetical protein MUP82_10385 [Candidatus Marinimicrobia bacterium]|nr:hypothetical protein [Candidatus Neomarinimicrobiota bacterium]
MLIPCILYRISIDTIIDFDTQLETTSPIPPTGLDPDLVYYAKYKPYVEPEYDPRGWLLVVNSMRKEIPHPDEPRLNQYETTYSLERKTDFELEESVDSMEAWANDQLCPSNHNSNITRVSKVHHKKIKEMPIEDWEGDLTDLVDNIADKMDSNSDNKDLMYDFIEANPTLVPDFDAGWTTS